MKRYYLSLCLLLLIGCSTPIIEDAPVYSGNLSKIYFEEYIATKENGNYEILSYNVDPYKLGSYEVIYINATGEKHKLPFNVVAESTCEVHEFKQNLIDDCGLSDTSRILINTIDDKKPGSYEVVYQDQQEIKKLLVTLTFPNIPLIVKSNEFSIPKGTNPETLLRYFDQAVQTSEDTLTRERYFRINNELNYEYLNQIGTYSLQYCIRYDNIHEYCSVLTLHVE